MNLDTTLFEYGALVYPQPIALACGRICRARHTSEQLEAILKCAETVTRYVAAVALSSFAARTDAAIAPPPTFSDFKGNLSFGHFLSLLQGIAKVGGEHPIAPVLQASFVPKAKGTSAAADAALTALLNLRNSLGHELQLLDEAKALAEFNTQAPDQALRTALTSLESILRWPLFLVEYQSVARKQITARRLVLMGEAQDPFPQAVDLSADLDQPYALYVGGPDSILNLYPILIWDLAEAQANYSIYFIHAIAERTAKFITVSGAELQRSDLQLAITDRLAGVASPAETISLYGGQSFYQEWQSERARRTPTLEKPIPWKEMDTRTVQWFGQQLGADPSKDDTRKVIRERLFDGRERLTPDEIRQVQLLLGTEATVRRLLHRMLIDCRARQTMDTRWAERLESVENVLECLKLAIEFFGRHIGVQGLNLDGLRATAGTADYIAVREALVNLFIHQDYGDARTVAQIEVMPERTEFFNAGSALVSVEALAVGGKSQSRNPVISRALRLIGFAELAGSGLREVERAWWAARHRPPRIESSEAANTFNLALDWNVAEEEINELWHQRTGVKLTPLQARALLLADHPGGTNAAEIASALDVPYEDAIEIARYLRTQAVVREQDDRLYLPDHLKTVADEAQRGVTEAAPSDVTPIDC